MARLQRLSPVGIPQHVIQRGNNRQVCFCCEQDFISYVGWLKEYAKKYRVEVYLGGCPGFCMFLPLEIIDLSCDAFLDF